jgi:hypothetical protein
LLAKGVETARTNTEKVLKTFEDSEQCVKELLSRAGDGKTSFFSGDVTLANATLENLAKINTPLLQGFILLRKFSDPKTKFKFPKKGKLKDARDGNVDEKTGTIMLTQMAFELRNESILAKNPTVGAATTQPTAPPPLTPTVDVLSHPNLDDFTVTEDWYNMAVASVRSINILDQLICPRETVDKLVMPLSRLLFSRLEWNLDLRLADSKQKRNHWFGGSSVGIFLE